MEDFQCPLLVEEGTGTLSVEGRRPMEEWQCHTAEEHMPWDSGVAAFGKYESGPDPCI